MGNFDIVIGAQAGSEAKGKLSGYLCATRDYNLIAMASSPNAGHTVVTKSGEKKVSYHLPIGMVMCDCPVVLGPTSVFNLDNLEKEIIALGIDPRRITIDPRAALIHSHHIYIEKNNDLSDIGSTLQGIGECRRAKIARRNRVEFVGDGSREISNRLGVTIAPTSPIISDVLGKGGRVLCESTQGFDLDLEHGIDPVYCTSKMINPAMVMAEAGVSPREVGEIFGVFRPYPIRVNNRTGTSGPYAGSPEITWDEVASRCGYPSPSANLAEITTTTKLPRRVFEFCDTRFAKFIQVCRPTSLCLQFANYIDWGMYEVDSVKEFRGIVRMYIDDIESIYGVPVKFIGTGPAHQHMIER